MVVSGHVGMTCRPYGLFPSEPVCKKDWQLFGWEALERHRQSLLVHLGAIMEHQDADGKTDTKDCAYRVRRRTGTLVGIELEAFKKKKTF